MRLDAAPVDVRAVERAEVVDVDPVAAPAADEGESSTIRPAASSWRITASGMYSSRCRRRIVRSRATSAAEYRRYPPGVRRGVISF